MSVTENRLKGSVGLKGLAYRGGGPMLSWLLHRIGGLGMVIFVSLHMLSTFLDYQLGSDVGRTLNTIYESIYFQVFIAFFVMFHVLNGIRIILLDTWPRLLEFQREATWLQWLIFIPVYGMSVFLMIQRAISGE
jgi:succinate dehydrogenase / fumarate reductase, cytochrome b subunit